MPDNVPKYRVTASHIGEIFGIDVADIKGKPHLVCVDYKSCCIFEWPLSHLVCVDYKSCCIFEWPLSTLHTSEIINALKSLFCDAGVQDKIISDNARYFVSQEFEDFTMQWAIQHITSSPRFPHGNAHMEKAVHVVRQIYEKTIDVKLALLLLKTMPILNKKGTTYDALAMMFCSRQLKAHVPILWGFQLQTTDEDENGGIPDLPSKYHENQPVWVKLDLNSKWLPGKIQQILPNQSYDICLADGCIFRRNEHHVTSRQLSQSNQVMAKAEADPTKCDQHSHNLRKRKT